MAESENETWMTPYYTLVGDNIDKNVTPWYMRVDKQVESIHAWHLYTTLDCYNTADTSKNVTRQKIDADKYISWIQGQKNKCVAIITG